MSKPRSLTDAQIAEMVELYAAGFNQVQLAEHFGTNDSVVRKWLKRSGIKTHYNVKLTEAQVVECVSLYGSGLSTIALGEKFGVSQQTVATALERAGVELRASGGRRRLALKEDVFDVLTPESAYWIGVMATDGCVTGTGGVIDEVKLALKIDDSDHVLAFRDFLGSEHAVALYSSHHPVDRERETDMCRFAVRSRRLVAALARYGVVPRKTQTLGAQGGVETSRDYWRGVMDGDGHVGIHASNQGPDVCLKLAGASERLLIQFRDFLKAAGVRGESNVTGDGGAGSLATHAKFSFKLAGNAALDAIAILYVDGEPVLARKARAAAEAILRGSRGELVGTIWESWRNDRAVAWAKQHLASADGVTRRAAA